MSRVRSGIRYLLVSGLLLAVSCTTESPKSDTGEPPPIAGRIGAYALPDRDLKAARKAGVQLMIRRGNPTRQTLQQDVSVVNGRIATLLYQVACPGGAGHCEPANDQRLTRLREQIRDHLDAAEPSPALPAAFLVTDDYWGDLSSYLPTVADELRSAYPTVPLVCSFHLAVPDKGESNALTLRTFRRSLVNYSPAWCSRVAMYAYSKTHHAPGARAPVWSMENVLKPALDELSQSGRPSSQPWTGVVQAFGFTPRWAAGHRTLTRPEWVQPPRPQDLATQTKSFCRAGADSIWVYAWEEPSRGKVLDVKSQPKYLSSVISASTLCS